MKHLLASHCFVLEVDQCGICKRRRCTYSFGIIAQDLEQAFADQGLDAHNYAMFCEDTWYEVDGQQET